MCISLDISVCIVRFGDWAFACRIDTFTSHQKWTHQLRQKFLVLDELSDNNASDDGLSLSISIAVNKQIPEVIIMLGNDAILMVYQINAHYSTYACDRPTVHSTSDRLITHSAVNRACTL